MVICQAKQTKSENQIIYICDFRRGVLNVRFRARIQHLLPDHKYEVLDSLDSVFGYLSKLVGRFVEENERNRLLKK